MMKAIATLLLLLTSTAAMAAPGSSKPYGMGGWFDRFDPVVAQYNQSGELFRIEGHCQSACTMFLGIKNVCIESGARLLFHGGHDRQRKITAQATNKIVSHYNEKLKSYLTANHVMETLAFHTVSGRDMISKFGYKECPRK